MAGQQKRNGQSQRYRERVKNRKPREAEAVNEGARVITPEKFFRAHGRPARLLQAIRAPAAKSFAALLFAGVPASAGAGGGAGAALETGSAFNPVILITRETALTFTRSMQLEFHQLERRWEHLRVRHPARQRRLLASLADNGLSLTKTLCALLRMSFPKANSEA